MNITGKTVEGGNIICLPQNPKIDTAIIFRLQCLLNTYREQLILHPYPVRDYLHFRKNTVHRLISKYKEVNATDEKTGQWDSGTMGTDVTDRILGQIIN